MDILNSNYVNESFVNPTYGERMGLTYRQAKGKLSLKDKMRLKLMKYLGRSRDSLKDKLQDKSLQAAGYAIKKADNAKNYAQMNPEKVLTAGLGVLGAGYAGRKGYKMYKFIKGTTATKKVDLKNADINSAMPPPMLQDMAREGNAKAQAALQKIGMTW